MKSVVEKIPTWALCYIVNGDSDGLTEEDLQMIENFYESYRKNGMQIQVIDPVSDNGNEWVPYFSYYPAFGLGAEVVDCAVLYNEC